MVKEDILTLPPSCERPQHFGTGVGGFLGSTVLCVLHGFWKGGRGGALVRFVLWFAFMLEFLVILGFLNLLDVL